MSNYFLVTTCYRNKSSWKWQHRRKNIAIIETDGTVPKIISKRPKCVKSIPWVRYGLYEGTSERSQYSKALKEAEEILEKLNNAISKSTS